MKKILIYVMLANALYAADQVTEGAPVTARTRIVMTLPRPILEAEATKIPRTLRELMEQKRRVGKLTAEDEEDRRRLEKWAGMEERMLKAASALLLPEKAGPGKQ